jgi:hypothetical protein
MAGPIDSACRPNFAFFASGSVLGPFLGPKTSFITSFGAPERRKRQKKLIGKRSKNGHRFFNFLNRFWSPKDLQKPRPRTRVFPKRLPKTIHGPSRGPFLVRGASRDRFLMISDRFLMNSHRFSSNLGCKFMGFSWIFQPDPRTIIGSAGSRSVYNN